MARQFEPGGGVPDRGMVAVNLGRGLRRNLERVCSRRGVALTDYVRASVQREIKRESFWVFQALRYLAQVVLMALSTPFVESKIGFSSSQSKVLRSELRRFIQLIEDSAYKEFEGELSPEEKTAYGHRVAFSKALGNEPHWHFEVAGVEEVLRVLQCPVGDSESE